jgi:O-antigen/teichoic acid export membrane protein
VTNSETSLISSVAEMEHVNSLGYRAKIQTVPFLQLAPGRLRVWGIRSSVAMLDQALSSGAGLVLNLLLARWLSAEAYGAFAVAFAGALFLSGFHNVLLLEPMTVMGPSRYADRLLTYLRSQMKVNTVLVLIISALTMLTGVVLGLGHSRELGGAFLACGIALPFMLLLWVARRMCYVVQRPSAALAGSGLYFAVISVGLFALHSRGALTLVTAFGLMAVASLAASLVLLQQLGIIAALGHRDSSLDLTQVVGENWKYGRWLVASTTLNTVIGQSQVFMVAGALGLGAAGVLRAMQMPALVMSQIITATGLIVLPSMSSDIGSGSIARLRRKASLTAFALTSTALVYAVALFFFSGTAEHILYGGKYSAYSWLIPMFAFLPLCSGFASGYSMALRASNKPNFDLLANSVAAPVAIVSCVLFIHWWGIAGAVCSVVLASAINSGMYYWSYRREHLGGASKSTYPRTGLTYSVELASEFERTDRK